MPDASKLDDALVDEVQALRHEVRRLNEQRYFRIESSIWRVALWGLVRGLAFGLGSVLGASILLSLVITFLASIDFIPVLGYWAQQLIDEIQRSPPP